jgi:hypothetical protein
MPMTREPLERLLHDVTDEELESLRDAILREEGRRRVQLELTINAPFPPLVRDDDSDSTVTRWAKLITWLAKDTGFPPAERKRGVSVRVIYADQPPDPQDAGIMIQQALVQAGLLLGRTPEWMDATATQLEAGSADAVRLQMWDKPDMGSWR